MGYSLWMAGVGDCLSNSEMCAISSQKVKVAQVPALKIGLFSQMALLIKTVFEWYTLKETQHTGLTVILVQIFESCPYHHVWIKDAHVINGRSLNQMNHEFIEKSDLLHFSVTWAWYHRYDQNIRNTKSCSAGLSCLMGLRLNDSEPKFLSPNLSAMPGTAALSHRDFRPFWRWITWFWIVSPGKVHVCAC